MKGLRATNLFDAKAQRHSRWRTLACIFAVAVLFNYLWELAQTPLYAGMSSFSTALRHCFVASLGDGLLVLLIFVTGWIVLKRQRWYERPGVRGYLLMFAVGLAIGVGVEWVAGLNAGQWAYTDRMPLVPWLRIGVAPVLQMLVLPPFIFRVVAAWTLGCVDVEKLNLST